MVKGRHKTRDEKEGLESMWEEITQKETDKERERRGTEKKNSNQHLPLSSYILSKWHSTQRRFPPCLTIHSHQSSPVSILTTLLHHHEISIKTVILSHRGGGGVLIKNFSMPLSVTAVCVPSWIYMLLKTITGRTSFTSSAKFVA